MVVVKGLAESVHDLVVLGSILATLEVLNEKLLIKNGLVSARSLRKRAALLPGVITGLTKHSK